MATPMTQRLQRGFLLLSVLLLVAGVVVFFGTRTAGGEDEGAAARPPADAPPAVPADPYRAETTQPKVEDVPRAARVVAGEFILAAAGREDLPKAWKLSHPDLKAQCGCTYKGWLTGNIPVQYYPVDNLDIASFAVHEARPDYIVLHVALLPEEKSNVKPQTFFIGLRPVGEGAKKKWLVDYWAPYAAVQVPALPEG